MTSNAKNSEDIAPAEFDTARENASARVRYHSLLAAVPDAVITIDERGIVGSFSEVAEDLFGYTAAEVIGQNIKMLMPLPYRAEHDGYMDRYKATGEKKIIGIGRDVEAQRKDGSVFPIHLSINEMLLEGRRMFIGVVHDTSQLHAIEAKTRRLAQIVEASVSEIYVSDAKTFKILDANAAARKNLGYTLEQMRTFGPWEFVEDLSRENIEELIEPLLKGPLEFHVFETTHRRMDGSTYPVKTQLQYMGSQSPPVLTATVQDISEIQHRETLLRQSQKMESIGQLTGGIAHDFNNLLTVIIGNNELLADRIAGDDVASNLLDDATGAAERGAKLTSQLLSFARKLPLSPETIDLNSLVQDMSVMLGRTLGETIELVTNLAPDVEKTLADQAQVRNALLNLAINARDAMPDGGKLTIETSSFDLDAKEAAERADTDPGSYVRLSVRDTGTGMPKSVQALAFEPFFTTKEKGKGTGLGLSMVHGFAKQSGGYLDLHSEVGYGTVVSMYLPKAPEMEEASQPREAKPARMSKGGETVLVVEDDSGVRRVTVKRLEHLGYKTIEAETGRQALDLLARSPPIDILFTDMVMPGGMTGAELVKEVRQLHPDMNVIITSGYADDGAKSNDGTTWLRKPYTLQEMALVFR